MFFQVFWKASPDMCLFWRGYGSENILQELIVKVDLKYYSRATNSYASVNKVHLCNWGEPEQLTHTSELNCHILVICSIFIAE